MSTTRARRRSSARLGVALFASTCLGASCGSGTTSQRASGEEQIGDGSGGEPDVGPSPARSVPEPDEAATPPSDPPATPGRWAARVVASTEGSDVVMEGPCATGRCELAPVPIGPGAVRAIGMLDLAGAPVLLHSGALAPELASAQLPALVCTRAGGGADGRSSFLVVVLVREGTARVVLEEETPSSESTIDMRTERGPEALDIVLVRSVRPRRGAAEFRPGPPLTDVFRLTAEGYVPFRP